MTLPNLRKNLDAEKSVLGAILLDPNLLLEANAVNLSAKDFFYTTHGAIYLAMQELWSEGNPVDTLTVCERANKLHEGTVSLEQLILMFEGVPKVSNIKAYLEIVQECARLRKLTKSGQNLMMSSQEPRATVEEVMADAHRELAEIGTMTDRKIRPLREIVPAVIEHLEIRRKEGRPLGLTTTLPTFDHLTGGVVKGRLYVVAARPAVGKTSLVLNWVNKWNRAKLRVAVFSAEMASSDLVARMLAAEAEIMASRVMNVPHQLDETEAMGLRVAADRLATDHVWVSDSARMTVEEVTGMALEAEKAMGRLDVIVVDYLQLLDAQDSARHRTRAEYVAEITRRLLSLAKSTAPVIAVAQLNRQAGEDEIAMEHSKDSGEIEQAAAVWAGLARKRDSRTDFTLHILKNRNGPVGKIELVFNTKTLEFCEVTDGEDYFR